MVTDIIFIQSNKYHVYSKEQVTVDYMTIGNSIDP